MSATELHANLIHRVNVGDSLTRSADRRPNAIAVVEGDARYTYAALNTWVNRVANALHDRGYRRGDSLALASGNCVEFLVTYYACAKLGVVCVPINLGWRSQETAYVLEHSSSRGIVVESQLLEQISDALVQVPAVAEVIVAPGIGAGEWNTVPGRSRLTFAELTSAGSVAEPEHLVGDRDPITYLYTSGTTSFPKGVVGNHTAIYLESMSMALESGFRDDDRFIAMLPMFHTAQLNCHCTAALMVGATIYIRRGFDADEVLDQIEREAVTQIFGLPTMYRAMLEHPQLRERDLSSLRRACYAMAPMPNAQLEQCLTAFGCDFYLLFGQTEMSPTATMFRPEHQLSHAGAVGTPVVNIQVAIMDAEGDRLPRGAEGEIVYRGPHTMTEYLNNRAATEEAFAHGWFHSGDIGHIDGDGILWFSDRRKDVIKTGGENVASIEVEKAVYAADPNVAEAVVVGLPHDRWNEAITAVVVAKQGARIDETELKAALRHHVDAYKVPKAVIVVDALPRTSTGKIQKNIVRQQFSDYYRQ
ncbi:long-chain-fatty-acid--CoA ligase [Nocardia nova]|uniref:long-chain-fatty-acid--CoA ligase n=1 Tax=Nocardia nova TaxID=37330 RepID=UPI001C4401B3|nr:long-chain-fatty-acid--CoA ligase [Nocardia nova]MBV7707032.1 long-chain-fatty-acid--CoA ligase [Nocardia nova]